MKTMSLQEVLHQNKINTRKKEIAKIKAERKANRRLNIVISLLTALALILILSLNKKMTDNALESCLNNGHSANYCESHL